MSVNYPLFLISLLILIAHSKMAPPYNPYPYVDENFLKVPEDCPRMFVLRNLTAYIPLPPHETYRRIRTNRKIQKFEHILRICSEDVATESCGFWMNVKNNKTVESGATVYNPFLKKLVIESFRKKDDGFYMTGDRNSSIAVFTVKGIL